MSPTPKVGDKALAAGLGEETAEERAACGPGAGGRSCLWPGLGALGAPGCGHQLPRLEGSSALLPTRSVNFPAVHTATVERKRGVSLSQGCLDAAGSVRARLDSV